MASFFQWGEPFVITLRHHKRSIRRNWCRIIQQTAFLLLQQLLMWVMDRLCQWTPWPCHPCILRTSSKLFEGDSQDCLLSLHKPVLSGCRRHSSNTQQFHGSWGLVTAANGLQTQEPDSAGVHFNCSTLMTQKSLLLCSICRLGHRAPLGFGRLLGQLALEMDYDQNRWEAVDNRPWSRMECPWPKPGDVGFDP